jgi:hypothetical protein
MESTSPVNFRLAWSVNTAADPNAGCDSLNIVAIQRETASRLSFDRVSTDFTRAANRRGSTGFTM